MNTLTISSIFVLLAIGSGVLAQPAFADHSEAIVSQPEGASNGVFCQTNECFAPADVSIDVGGTVTWTNDDILPHSIEGGDTSNGPSFLFGPTATKYLAGVADGTLEEGISSFNKQITLLSPSEEYSFTFDDFEPGTYPYFCLVHPWMAGTVTVVAAEAVDDGMMMDEPSAMYALSDGTAIKLYSGEPTEGEQLEITVLFVDSEHVNYDLMVTQGDDTVLEDIAAHEHQGMGTHTTAPLASSDPVDVTITFQGFGVTEPFTGDSIGEEAVFTGVVPEFGTIAMIILGVAVMSIVAVTARSRIVPRI
jgi:predicted secreted protein with PEFG-CTERM motif